MTLRRAGSSEKHHARRQRDLDSDCRVFGDPARSLEAIVQAIVKEERVARVEGQAQEGVLRRERAGLLAVARAAGAAIPSERLYVEELPALLKALPGALLGEGGIAIQWDVLPEGVDARFPSDGPVMAAGHEEQRRTSNDNGGTMLEVHVTRSLAVRLEARYTARKRQGRTSGR